MFLVSYKKLDVLSDYLFQLKIHRKAFGKFEREKKKSKLNEQYFRREYVIFLLSWSNLSLEGTLT